MANLVFKSRSPDYSDLDLDFFKHPTTKDVVRKTGEDAIKRSVRNLIFTNFYERPFRSYIGSGVRQILFDNATPLTSTFLENAIKDVINNFEPRVSVLKIVVSVDEDRNGFNVELQYVIKNREQPVITSIFLERVR